jgi:hypothetical protein
MLPLLRPLVVPLAVTILIAACGGGNIASKLANAPDYNPKDQTKCGVTKSQAKPLIVEWPSPERMELENKVRQGLVVVHYVGCEMSVLDRCSVSAKYTYQGATRNQDKVEMKDEDDLYANLPVGAAKLEGKLQRSGRLTVDMNLVGRFEAEKASVHTDELQGDCAGATHFVYGVTVGAFDFYAGGQANVAGSVGVGSVGAGGHSQAERETLTKAGDQAACERATSADTSPPEGCGALIRIEVVPLGAAPIVTPTCPPGTSWDGAQCVARSVDCPAGSHWSGARCLSLSPPPALPPVPAPAAMSQDAAQIVPASPGRAPSEIRAVVVANRDQIRVCYDAGLQAHPGIEGDLVVNGMIDAAGNVAEASLDTVRSQIREPGVVACVLNAVRRLKFAATANGAETRFFYPFNFHPRRAPQ